MPTLKLHQRRRTTRMGPYSRPHALTMIDGRCRVARVMRDFAKELEAARRRHPDAGAAGLDPRGEPQERAAGDAGGPDPGQHIDRLRLRDPDLSRLVEQSASRPRGARSEGAGAEGAEAGRVPVGRRRSRSVELHRGDRSPRPCSGDGSRARAGRRGGWSRRRSSACRARGSRAAGVPGADRAGGAADQAGHGGVGSSRAGDRRRAARARPSGFTWRRSGPSSPAGETAWRRASVAWC